MTVGILFRNWKTAKKNLAKNGGISVEGFDCESGVSLDKVPQLVVASCFETKHDITRAFSEGQLLQRSSHSHDGRTRCLSVILLDFDFELRELNWQMFSPPKPNKLDLIIALRNHGTNVTRRIEKKSNWIGTRQLSF